MKCCIRFGDFNSWRLYICTSWKFAAELSLVANEMSLLPNHGHFQYRLPDILLFGEEFTLDRNRLLIIM